MGEEKRDEGWECVCKRDIVGDGIECESVRVGGGREREYDDRGEKVGGGRGKERGGGWGCMCKRDRVGDGRE